MTLAIKAGIIVTLVAILVSLGSGLFHLVRERKGGSSRRVVNALTVRISLSVLLFALIVLGMFTGVIQPNASPLS